MNEWTSKITYRINKLESCQGEYFLNKHEIPIWSWLILIIIDSVILEWPLKLHLKKLYFKNRFYHSCS